MKNPELSERSQKLSSFGESNLRRWGRDVRSTYIDRPWEEGDPLRMGAGVGMAGASAVLEGPDHVIGDLLGNRIETPEDVPFGRIRRDLGMLAKNIFTLHPIRAISDVVRGALSSLPLDIGDILTGMDHKKTFAMRQKTRTEVSHVLAV